jgi:hypothetical protein
MTDPTLALRDIHLPPAPGWWPPAPGWWVIAVLLSIGLAWSARRLFSSRKIQRRIRIALCSYDQALADASDAPTQLAMASTLLRRAARTRDPAAAQLDGDAWMRFLDGDDPTQPFSNAPGCLLRDGGFRRVVDGDVAPALMLARARFITLLQGDHVRHDHA